MQIYSLAEGVCCKASALAASALATNTYVSAINLHQCSAADLNPYNNNELARLLTSIWTIGFQLKTLDNISHPFTITKCGVTEISKLNP